MPSSGCKGVSWNNRMKAWLTFYYDNKVRRSRTFHPKNYNNDIQKSLKAAIDFAKTVNTGPRATSYNLKEVIGNPIKKKPSLGLYKYISKCSYEYANRIKSSDKQCIFHKKTKKAKKPKINYHEDFLEDLNYELSSKNWLRSSLSPNFPIEPSTDKFDYVSIEDLVGTSRELGSKLSSNQNFNDLKSAKEEIMTLERKSSNNIFLELQLSENKRDIFTFDPEHIQQSIEFFHNSRNFDDENQKLRRKGSNDSIIYSSRFSNSCYYKSYSGFTTALILRQGSNSMDSTSIEMPTQVLSTDSIEKWGTVSNGGSFYSRNGFFDKLFN